MEFKKKILSNGLSIIGEVNKSAKSAAVGFFVKTGSRDETKQINGVSHFLEHMLFKGTDRLNAFEVSESFDRMGAQFNASTNEETTVFYSAVLPEYLEDTTRLWAELMRPALRDEDFNIEKNVIKEEIAMYQDTPSFDVTDRCKSMYFNGHPCGNSVLGSVESIDALRADQMREYFISRYSPNNMVLVYSGNFGWGQICSVAENCCSRWEKQEVKRVIEEFSGSRKQGRLEKPNLAVEHICLMSHAASFQDRHRFAALLMATIIGDDVGSRFFWQLVDKALAEVATMQFGPMDGTGAFYSYIRCSKENTTKVLDTVSDIFGELSKSGVTEDELEKAKNKTLSALVIKNELPMGRLVDLGFNWTYLGQYRTVEDDINSIKAVTTDEIHLLIEKLKPGEFTQFSIGPAK